MRGPGGATLTRGCDRGRMAVLRTPDHRFGSLPDYPFEPRYALVEAKGLEPVRMNYVDAGPSDGPVVLLVHGQPTWSYLYRKVIAELAAAGLRAIAPDNIGFGRSDKLTEPTDYTFRRHVDWLHSFVRGLDLRDVTLVAQDWGGPLGLSVLAREPDRFARVVATNTILHTYDPALAGRLTWAHHGVDDGRVLMEEQFLDYLALYQRAPDIVASFFLDAVAGPLSADVLAAYDAPFPSKPYKAGLQTVDGAGPPHPQRPRRGHRAGHDGGARAMAQAVPDRLFRRRPRNTGLGDGVPGARPRSTRSAPHHDRGRRPLRSGAARRGAGAPRRPVRRRAALSGYGLSG